MIASYKRIFAIALPIMASNAMLPLVGMVDAAVIGRLGEIVPLAAIGLGNLIVTSMFWLFMFLSVTTTASIGQAMSKGDEAAVREQIGRALMIAIALSLFVVLLIPFWAKFLPWLFQASDAATPYVASYIAIRLLASPAALYWRVASGVLIARENTRAVFIIEMIIQLINLVLDILFVFGFGMGVAGVAMASAIAQFIGMFAGIYWLREDLRAVWADRLRIWAGRVHMRAMLTNSGFVFTRSLALQIMISAFYIASSWLGDDVLAMNSILQQFIMFTAMATDGFAVAVEVLVARSIGAKDRMALRANIWRCFQISLGLTILISFVIFFFGNDLYAMITTNELLRHMVEAYWLWLILALVLGIVSWTMDGVYFGSNLGKEMMLAMIMASGSYLAFLFILVPIWGNTGLWIAFILSYVFRAVMLFVFYPRVEGLISA